MWRKREKLEFLIEWSNSVASADAGHEMDDVAWCRSTPDEYQAALLAMDGRCLPSTVGQGPRRTRDDRRL